MGGSQAESTSPDDKAKSCELLHDQALYLLDDEVHYATSLRENRRTLATLLALVVGVGIFKVDFYRPPGHILAVPELAFWVIRGLFICAIIAFLVAAYFIYTERAIMKEFGKKRTGGALSVLSIQDRFILEFAEKPAHEVWMMKTEGLRLAYYRLQESNRRVRRRLAEGTIVGFVGLVLVLSGITLYTVTVRVEGAKNEPIKLPDPRLEPKNDGSDR